MEALIALLDANVLWSAAVRDTLLLAAEANLFRPAWTLAILDEMAKALKRKRPDLDPMRIDRMVARILVHFPEALVEGYEPRIPRMPNEPADRHVLAAAVEVGAAYLVTWNGRHFPAQVCAPYGITVETPDAFICRLWESAPEAMAGVLVEQAAHSINPPRTVHEILGTLGRSPPRFAERARRSGLL